MIRMLTTGSFCLLAILTTPMFAQEPLDKEALAEQNQKMVRRLQLKREAAGLRFDNLIEDIHLTCNLDDKQRTKLKIVSKGAVSKFMSKAIERATERAKQFGIDDFDPDQELTDLEETEKGKSPQDRKSLQKEMRKRRNVDQRIKEDPDTRTTDALASTKQGT